MTACSQEELEALTREELPWPSAQRVLGHVAGCADCARELAWLSTEAELARRPDEPIHVAHLWPRVEARLQREPRRTGVVALAGLVALAAAAAIFVAWRPRPAPAPVPVPPPVAAPAPAPEPAPPVVHAPVVLPTQEAEAALAVRGPVVFELTVEDAEVTVDRCRGRFVNLHTSGEHRELRLIAERRGRVRAEIDGGAVLRGRARVLLPRGSRLVLRGPAEVVDKSGGAIAIQR